MKFISIVTNNIYCLLQNTFTITNNSTNYLSSYCFLVKIHSTLPNPYINVSRNYKPNISFFKRRHHMFLLIKLIKHRLGYIIYRNALKVRTVLENKILKTNLCKRMQTLAFSLLDKTSTALTCNCEFYN